MRKPQRPLDLYLASPAFEDALFSELSAAGRGPRPLTAGVLATPTGPLEDPCFARQALPAARFVAARGPSELCDAALAALDDDDALALYAGAARLFVFAPDFFRRGSGPPAPHPLAGAADEVAQILAKKVTGRAKKRGVAPAAGPASRLVQVLLTGSYEAFVSAAPLPTGAPGVAAWPGPLAGGRARIPHRPQAPSSAYKKLEEALAWLGAVPGEGETVLDLGAAPGGWTAVALAYGADVIAFDRAQLAPPLEGHPRVRHVQEDAFEHAPLEEASWLLCDVIDVPDKSLALIRRALACPALFALVVTLKLTRPVDVRVLERARALVATADGFLGRAKHLTHNKCEITVMMRRAPPAEESA